MPRRIPATDKRHGFTLVELLVVIAIITVLVALLFPAVQSAREAARRLQCHQNLRQLAIAMHNYHTIHRAFPYGVNAGWGHSWSAHLLPYVEQMSLAETIPWSERGWWGGPDQNSVALRRLARTRLYVFRCPSQGRPLTSDVNQLSGRFVTNYLACAGGDATGDNRGPGGMDRSNGMFLAAIFTATPRPPTRWVDVRDGTSNTLMLSEAAFVVDGNAGCFTCDRFYLYHPNADSGDGSDFSEALGSTYYVINSRSPREVERECAFSSYHSSGIVGALADGSVRFFAESLDLDVWRALGSMQGNEPVTFSE
jgi:prepilin-type N-terminal cleavage/methylation domain-containing protein